LVEALHGGYSQSSRRDRSSRGETIDFAGAHLYSRSTLSEKMKNRKFTKRLRTNILLLCLINLASFYIMTSRPKYTTCSISTDDEGVTVYQIIEDDSPVVPFEGKFLIKDTNSEYMNVGSVRENIIVTAALVFIAYLLSVSCDEESRKIKNP